MVLALMAQAGPVAIQMVELRMVAAAVLAEVLLLLPLPLQPAGLCMVVAADSQMSRILQTGIAGLSELSGEQAAASQAQT